MDDVAVFPYTFGIEEEFFLAHPTSRSLSTGVPRSLLRACQRRFGECVAPELLHSQIELVSPVVRALRPGVRRDAAPAARRRASRGREGPAHARVGHSPDRARGASRSRRRSTRYRRLIEDFQIVARRNVLCGLHIHVAVPPGVDRVALMNRAMPWLPVFLALSTSLAVLEPRADRPALATARPRTTNGRAPASRITSRTRPSTRAFVELLVAGGAARTRASCGGRSARRALPDARAAHLRCVHARRRHAWRSRRCTAASCACWCGARARRAVDAVHAPPDRREPLARQAPRARRAVPFARRQPPVACRDAIAALLDDVAEDAQALGCEKPLERVRALMREGTSAHLQLALFRARREKGDTPYEALQFVVDWLVATTVAEGPVSQSADVEGTDPAQVPALPA